MQTYQEKRPKPFKLKISPGQYYSVIYHSLFDYPLALRELIKWRFAEDKAPKNFQVEIESKKGFLYVAGKAKSIIKRQMRTKFSQAKMARAQRAAEVLALVPWISFVGVTGSLAMTNADDESDIDLMLITKGGRLWTSRLASYILLRLAGYPLRKPRNNSEKDKLCLNIWLDENNLAWDSHNRYTAHEIAQIIPLFDRGVFAKFLQNNSWAGEYWPKAYKDQKSKSKRQNTKSSSYLVASSKGKRGSNIRARLAVLGRVIADGVERLAYGMQSFYMKKKITREVVTPGRAIFHPVDMGEWVLKRKKIA